MHFIKWISIGLTALLTALLPACDLINLPQIEPGKTTAAEVRKRMGEPSAIFSEQEGEEIWEYSRQPNGVHSYHITIGPNQMVTRVSQILTPANYAKIQPGMNKTAVRRILGKPGSIQPFDNLGEEVWEWRIEGDMPTEETYFNVYFSQDTEEVKKAGKRVAPKG